MSGSPEAHSSRHAPGHSSDSHESIATYATWHATHSYPSARFARHFVAETGTTPLRWLHTQRLLHARELLERTQLPIEEGCPPQRLRHSRLAANPPHPEPRHHADRLPHPVRPLPSLTAVSSSSRSAPVSLASGDAHLRSVLCSYGDARVDDRVGALFSEREKRAEQSFLFEAGSDPSTRWDGSVAGDDPRFDPGHATWSRAPSRLRGGFSPGWRALPRPPRRARASSPAPAQTAKQPPAPARRSTAYAPDDQQVLRRGMRSAPPASPAARATRADLQPSRSQLARYGCVAIADDQSWLWRDEVSVRRRDSFGEMRDAADPQRETCNRPRGATRSRRGSLFKLSESRAA